MNIYSRICSFSDLIKTQEDAMRQKGEAARQMARAEEAEQASEQLRGKLKVEKGCRITF